MRSRSRVWVVWMFALLTSPVFADVPRWVLYTHPDKLMSVRFPGKPIEANQEGTSPYGTTHGKVATFIDGDRALVATAAVYPDHTKLDVKVVLDAAASSIVGRFPGSHVVAQKSIMLDGVEGRDVQFTGPGPYNKPLRGAVRIFASTNPPTSYLMMALQMDGSTDPNATRFFDSLRLGKTVEIKP